MTVGLYFKRLPLMLLIAMPAGAVVLALSELASDRTASPVDVLGGALALVYVWGAVTGTLASLAHTGLVRNDPSRGSIVGVLAGAFFGAVTGGLTPTPFTGFLQPAAIGLGALVGTVYVALIPAWDRLLGGRNVVAS